MESQTENDFVMVNLKRAGVANAFIGLYVNNDDQFVWTDGSVYDYTSWSTGEPNGFFGLEGCATMFTGSGHWNDVYCGRPQNGFACKRKAEGIWTTPQPTQLPPGHCSSDQFEYKGFCYKFVGMDGNASLHRNWTEAQKECQ